jgi:hypothetical protein
MLTANYFKLDAVKQHEASNTHKIYVQKFTTAKKKKKKKTRDLTGFRVFNQLKNMRMTVKL